MIVSCNQTFRFALIIALFGGRCGERRRRATARGRRQRRHLPYHAAATSGGAARRGTRRAAAGGTGEFRSVELVELTKLDPTIKLDIRYATTNNFLSTPVYTRAAAYLQRPAAEALVRVHRALASQGYGLLIHDAYRPWWVTKVFWEATPLKLQGVRRRSGAGLATQSWLRRRSDALRLAHWQSGVDAERLRRDVAARVSGLRRRHAAEREHRELLRRAMEREGFTVYETEWWHFDFKDWRRVPDRQPEFLTRAPCN